MSSSKDVILANIRKNKPAPVEKPILPGFGRSGVEGDLLETFKKNLKAAYANWHEAESTEKAAWLVQQLHPDAKLICSAIPEIPGNRPIQPTDDPHQLENVDVGIVRARFGVAENGAVWLTQDDLIVNALGFLSQHLIILLDPKAIVTHMHEAYEKANVGGHHYGCFMMGPSATANISAVHIDGAQGARSLNVILLQTGATANKQAVVSKDQRLSRLS